MCVTAVPCGRRLGGAHLLEAHLPGLGREQVPAPRLQGWVPGEARARAQREPLHLSSQARMQRGVSGHRVEAERGGEVTRPHQEAKFSLWPGPGWAKTQLHTSPPSCATNLSPRVADQCPPQP